MQAFYFLPSLRSWRDFVRECICFGCEAENAIFYLPSSTVLTSSLQARRALVGTENILKT